MREKKWGQEKQKDKLIKNTPTIQASKLVLRSIDLINSNLANSDFSVNKFAKKMFLR